MCNLVYSSKNKYSEGKIKMTMKECIIKWIEEHLLVFSLKDFWIIKSNWSKNLL